MQKYDADQICSDNPIVDVISGFIKLKKDGNEFKACCPFHDEKTPSFSVVPEKGFYHCFGCGAHGDQIDFVMEYDQVDFNGACEILGGEKSASENRSKKRQSKKIDIVDIYEGIKVLPIVDDGAPVFEVNQKTAKIFNPKRADDPEKKAVVYNPSMVFPYKNTAGKLIGYVLRIEFGDGKKITPTITWCKKENQQPMFMHCSFPEPRPFYGAEDLPENKPVLLCEGEKARDAAKRLLGMHYTCLSWNGGTQAIAKTDWSELKDKRILIWPDNDQPGIDCVLGTDKKDGIINYLNKVGVESIKYIGLDNKKEKGWDAADAETSKMNTKQVITWAKKHIIEFTQPEPASQPKQEYQEPEYDNTPPADYHEQDNTNEETLPFRTLGFNRGLFYYLPDRSQQLIALSASQHTKNNLFAIASANHWEIEYPQKTGFDLDQAVNALLGRSYNKGLFDPHELLRGRGAWLDNGRTVLHLGSRCYVDGVEVSPRNVKSKYIYENQSELSVKLESPATNKEAYKLVEISEDLSWENQLSAALMVGWCVVSPVCGILKWRPHIWVTGPSGSGKSTVLKDIITTVVGSIALEMEGSSTEAGVRQEISQDARPVVFDEAEAEDEAGAKRMKSVLALARVSSSGGKIIKGGQSGGSMSFSIRSCFCFSSINTSMKDYADESRISKLILKADKSEGSKEKYDLLDKEIKNTFNKEYSAKMLSRSVKYMTVLQHNCKSFVDAATRVFGSRRLADQIGTLLAGYYLCHSIKEISSEQAEEWMNKKDWSDHTDIINRQDEQRLLEYITTRRVRVEDQKGFHDVSIGELILCVDRHSYVVEQSAADRELRRRGIIVDFTHVLIANNCQPMRELLTATAWSSDWSRPLKDLYKAEITKVKYFSPGIKSRAVKLSIDLFKEG